MEKAVKITVIHNKLLAFFWSILRFLFLGTKPNFRNVFKKKAGEGKRISRNFSECYEGKYFSTFLRMLDNSKYFLSPN